MWLTESWYSLDCETLEPKSKYLQGMSVILSFPECHIFRLMQYIQVGLFYLIIHTKVSSMSIHGLKAHLFLAPNNIPLSGCCCSIAKSCPTLFDLRDCSTPAFPVLHYLPELAQMHIHWVGDAIQPSHPLLSPSPSALNLSQHQGLFQWVGSSHQVAKVWELQHQSFKWIFWIDFL